MAYFIAEYFQKSPLGKFIDFSKVKEGKKCKTQDCVVGVGKSCLFLIYAAAAKSLQSCPTLCDPRDPSRTKEGMLSSEEPHGWLQKEEG